MVAWCERRQGRRCVTSRRLLVPVWFFLTTTGPVAGDPPPPDPPAAALESLPDRSLIDESAPARPPDQSLSESSPRTRGSPIDAAEEPIRVIPGAHRPAPPAAATSSTESPAEPDSTLQEQFQTRRSLNHVLYRDRRYRLLLEEARHDLSAGELHAAFDVIAQLASVPDDVFVWDAAARRPVSARQCAFEIVATLTPAQRDCHERYRGAAAQAALTRAVDSGRLDRLSSVARDFAGTTAAARAERIVAAQLFDSGRFTEAAASWRRYDVLYGEAMLSPQERQQAALAQRFGEYMAPASTNAGAASAARAADNRTGSPPYRIPVWSSAASTIGAEADRQREQLLHRRIEPDADASARDSIAEWMRIRNEARESLATVVSPIIVGHCVAVRGNEEVIVRDLATGRLLGRHRCETCLNGSQRPSDAAAGENPFNQTSAENALLATLTSDGRRLFFIDDIQQVPCSEKSLTLDPGAAADSDDSSMLVNRLVALALPSQTGTVRESGEAQLTPAWTVGGPENGSERDGPLAGHFFLGPPVSVDDLLLVLTERSGQVHLAGLDPATGAQRFLQPLVLVDRPVSYDSDRLRLAFQPACCDGVVVCPTPSGVVIAFNPATRSLAWAAQYRALETAVTASWRGDGRPGAALFPVQPIIAAGCVLFLPPDSVEVLALDLHDGSRLWSRPRRGAQQLAAAPGGRVLLVSSDRVTCCDLETGAPAWESNVEDVTGRGVLIGDALILPGAGGKLLALDLASGQPVANGPEILNVADTSGAPAAPMLSTRPPASAADDAAAPLSHSTGNLAVSDDWFVSASPGRTAAFVAADRLLAAAASEPKPTSAGRQPCLKEIVNGWSAPERLLRIAELELTRGRSQAALPQLLALQSQSERAGLGELPGRRARCLLREVLHAQLEAGTTLNREAILLYLEPLSEDALDEARRQLALLRHAGMSGDVAGWLDAAGRLADAPPDILLPIDVGRTLELSPRAAIRQSYTRLRSQLTEPGLQNLSAAIAAARSKIGETHDVGDMRRFLALFGEAPQADRVRIQLAHTSGHGRLKLEAESLLLQVRRSADTSVERMSERSLANLGGRYIPRAGRIAPALPAQAFTPRPRVSADNSAPPAGGIQQVAFAESDGRWFDPSWDDALACNVELTVQSIDSQAADASTDLSRLFDCRNELHRDPRSSIRVINVGAPQAAETSGTPTSSGESQVELVLLHRDSAEILGTVVVPERTREPLHHFQPDEGHFLPLADHQVHGVSLLDGARLWTASVVSGEASERVRLGPFGPGYCIVQTQGGLACLDPLTGAVRWQRSDVAADSGLYANEETGLFGDDDCIVVVGGDQRTCRVFDTASGVERLVATLPAHDVRRTRLAFGRRLFFASETDGSAVFRLWDAASGEFVHEDSAHSPVRCCRADRRHAAYASASGDVVVVDTRTAEEVLRHKLSGALASTLTGLTVWGDSDCWYVHTSHSGATTGGPHMENVGADVRLPALNINGRVTAYDRKTGQRKWTHECENRTVLVEPVRRLPFLIALCRTREGLTANGGGLVVEVLDKQTGRLLAQAVDLPSTRFVHSSFDPAAREFVLYGECLQIRVRYERQRRQPVITAENDVEIGTR